MEKKFKIIVNEKQARQISKALDLYTRLGLGQFEEISWLIRKGEIPFGNLNHVEKEDKMTFVEGIERDLKAAKITLGHSYNGSYGIFSEEVPVSSKRSYEIQKVIDKTVAVSNNPNPDFPTVDYDGLWTRLTDDSEPICEELK